MTQYSRAHRVAATFDLGRRPAESDITVELTALTEATVEYGSMRRTSRDGHTVSGRREVFRDGIGSQVIEVLSEGGPLEVSIDSGGDGVSRFTTRDPDPAAYRWRLVAQPTWSGGSVNEKAGEYARAELEGRPALSRPVGPDLPGRGVPAMPSSITRPWAPERDSESHGASAPRRGNWPIDG